MSDDETKLVDTAGDYCYVVRDGDQVEDPRWRSSRLVLTNKRLVLAGADGNQSLPLAGIELVDRETLDAGVPVDGATPLQVGDNVVLVDASDVEAFDREYCRAVVDREVILVAHPAVVGGVVQDTDWSKARFRFADEQVQLGFPGGESTSFPLEDVGTVETGSQDVLGEQRPVVRVEHTDADGRSVETHFSGTETHVGSLEHLFTAAIEDRGGEERELDETEREVLMALYSGVSPFEMADFVGLDVDEVERIYEKLLDMEAVDKVRERTEVTLNAHGRNLASESMSEE